jgi:type VI protein secretion system component VasK
LAAAVNPIAIRSRNLVTVMRGTLSLLGVLVFLVGVLFVGQGTNVIHGSSMSGHGSYAVLGGVLVVIGLGLVTWARRLHSRRKA